jgi:uncharacterized protein
MKHGTQQSPGNAENISKLLIAIARLLVDNPDGVSVESWMEREQRTVLRLRVDPKDVGKVIGSKGRTARSLRAILGAASAKLKHQYALDIVEVLQQSAIEK